MIPNYTEKEQVERSVQAELYFSILNTPNVLTDCNSLVQDALVIAFRHFDIKKVKIVKRETDGDVEICHAILDNSINFEITCLYDFLGLCKNVSLILKLNDIERSLFFEDEEIQKFGIGPISKVIEQEVFDAFYDLLCPIS